MRTLLLVIYTLAFVSFQTKAQEEEVNHKYKLVLTLDNSDLGFVNKPSMLLVTPDKKYLICSSGFKKPKFQFYDLENGQLVHEFVAKGKFDLARHYFEENEILYIGNGRKKAMKVNLNTGEHEALDCTAIGINLCDKLNPNLDIPAWTWEGGNLSEISYPNKYMIRYTPEKIYMYYNMDRL